MDNTSKPIDVYGNIPQFQYKVNHSSRVNSFNNAEYKESGAMYIGLSEHEKLDVIEQIDVYGTKLAALNLHHYARLGDFIEVNVDLDMGISFSNYNLSYYTKYAAIDSLVDFIELHNISLRSGTVVNKEHDLFYEFGFSVSINDVGFMDNGVPQINVDLLLNRILANFDKVNHSEAIDEIKKLYSEWHDFYADLLEYDKNFPRPEFKFHHNDELFKFGVNRAIEHFVSSYSPRRKEPSLSYYSEVDELDKDREFITEVSYLEKSRDGYEKYQDGSLIAEVCIWWNTVFEGNILLAGTGIPESARKWIEIYSSSLDETDIEWLKLGIELKDIEVCKSAGIDVDVYLASRSSK